MRAPDFWQNPASWAGRFLAPVGAAFGLAGWLRWQRAAPQTAAVPVICIGNLTAGGAGKTPVALAVAAAVIGHGGHPHFLTRGYGGRLRGPVRVDPAHHSADDVGDEPLLLAPVAPTWVARDRVAGARAAVAAGASAIIMDDGFQNPSLRKSLSLVVVDAATGMGNGRLLPAGPLREPVARGLGRADAIILIGTGDAPGLFPHGATARCPVLRARPVATDAAATWRGRRMLAFAGIGRPEKFFATLEQTGAVIVDRRAFPDHHPYRPDEIATLRADARRLAAIPVTTSKDAARLPADARHGIAVLPIRLSWDDPAAFEALLLPILNRRDRDGR
ncbi:MAG: tetraacyldisaccharide 4'-kinase [Azospirillaceae bacterium]|nr:tetraacyldisaccharide 4'-kinase [Azospirillaceae bacterium]